MTSRRDDPLGGRWTGTGSSYRAPFSTKMELTRWFFGTGNVADLVGTTEYIPHPDTDVPPHRRESVKECRRITTSYWEHPYIGPIFWEVRGQPALWIPYSLKDMEDPKTIEDQLRVLQELHTRCLLPAHDKFGDMEDINGLYLAYYKLTEDSGDYKRPGLLRSDNKDEGGLRRYSRDSGREGKRYPVTSEKYRGADEAATACFFWKSQGDW